MTREEQLVFCNQCTNRKLDLKQGLVCSITGSKADFEGECPQFVKDEKVKEKPLDNEQALTMDDVSLRLSGDILESLRAEQNLVNGIIAGILVGLLGATVWCLVTVSTGFQIGYMAVAIGAGVGFGIRYFGKGIDQIFGIIGAAIALFSCLIGNFLCIVSYMADAEGYSFFETLLYFDYYYLPDVMIETFSPMDVVFYGIALYEGYKFSFRAITEQDIADFKNKAALKNKTNSI
ncbi:MAG: hypothetical protein CMO01_17185 [Thalassobius sp.]|nr:hypothetical protein [Thalassovita sp.]